MNAMELPGEKEIRDAYQQGEEAVILLFQATILILAERIQKLEDQLAKNSNNSGKPPSSDGYNQPAPRSLRKRSRRKSGGQAGHRGETLKAVEKPDHIEVHRVTGCGHCGYPLKRRKAIGHEKRQVFDVPPMKIEVTEHCAEIKDCPCCGKETQAQFPSEVSKAVQYGTEVKVQMVYLNTEQHIPLERTCDLLEEFYGHRPSEGTIVTACAEAAQKVEKPNEAIKEHLVEKEEVAHFDETGMMINGILNWLHSASTLRLTCYAMHAKRGSVAMNEINILPRFKGRAVHDDLVSYFQYELKHALCNAHHLRTLLFLLERYPQKWIEPLKDLLIKIKGKVEAAKERCPEPVEGKKQTALSVRQINIFYRVYDQLIAQGLRANPPPNEKNRKPGQRGQLKQSPARNLLLRLQKHKESVLAFMLDFNVPFDNNQAERDLRMMKVKQKVSGGFRSTAGAQNFCQIRGYLSTARKNGVMALTALRLAFADIPFLPDFVAPLT
ncbi:MAG: IS66 family transposase [Chloroflexota bacterium]|nr:IS66 family transposase [Chloroflexota bacterium]